ncbi:MAG: hypothetical protein Q7S77_02520 [Candidatus Staskawiczbacteria bacterium]|nr:hypothetical protein [Candidatus Staskawiczbacteria bacterium]
MEIKKMTLSRIRELDKKKDEEVRKFLQLGVAYGEPLPLFLHEEYSGELPRMAEKFGVPQDEFQTYVWVQVYINASAQSDCSELPSPESIALQLGVPFAEFEYYLHEQIKLIHAALADDEEEEFFLPVTREEWDFVKKNPVHRNSSKKPR